MTTTPAPRRPGSARQLFARTILLCEVLVVLFAALVCFGLRVAPTGVILGAAAGLGCLCLAAAALLRRGRLGEVLGWAAQVLLVAAGVAMTVAESFLGVMVVVAVIFLAIWVVAGRVGRRIDVERQERYEAELALHRAAEG